MISSTDPGHRDLKLHPPDTQQPNGTETNGDAEGGNGAEEAYEEEEPGGWWDEEDPEAPWMTQSTRLMPNTTIALWQFTPFVYISREAQTSSLTSPRYLALVVLLRTETWQSRRGMIEYNLTFLRQGVRRILMEVDS